MQALEDPCLLPVAQAAPAGHAGAESELLRQPLPGDPGGEHEQDSVQDKAIVEPLATRIAAAPPSSWQEWLDQFPEFVVDHDFSHYGPPILSCFCESFRTRLLT